MLYTLKWKYKNINKNIYWIYGSRWYIWTNGILEIPKYYSEIASDEKNIMKIFFDNEIKIKEYMKIKIKKLEDEKNVKEEVEHEPDNAAEKKD